MNDVTLPRPCIFQTTTKPNFHQTFGTLPAQVLNFCFWKFNKILKCFGEGSFFSCIHVNEVRIYTARIDYVFTKNEMSTRFSVYQMSIGDFKLTLIFFNFRCIPGSPQSPYFLTICQNRLFQENILKLISRECLPLDHKSFTKGNKGGGGAGRE